MNQLDNARGRNYLNVCHVTTGTHRAPTKSERSQKNRSSLPELLRTIWSANTLLKICFNRIVCITPFVTSHLQNFQLIAISRNYLTTNIPTPNSITETWKFHSNEYIGLGNGKRYQTSLERTMSNQGSTEETAEWSSSGDVEEEVSELKTLTQETVNEQIG